jgi:hypothetical protein
LRNGLLVFSVLINEKALIPISRKTISRQTYKTFFNPHLGSGNNKLDRLSLALIHSQVLHLRLKLGAILGLETRLELFTAPLSEILDWANDSCWSNALAYYTGMLKTDRRKVL